MAASKRIAGITIEIGGDTTKLQSSLKGVDKQLNTTKANLKDINSLLKLNPTNTELLTQKQKALKSAVSDTETRLKKLKEAQTQVGKGTAEYDALQREIIQTEADLKDLQKQVKDFGSVTGQQLQAIGSKVKDVGNKMVSVGTSLTKYITAPIVAVGVAAYKAFTEVDAGLDIIIKKTGITGDALDEMQTALENIVTSIPTDFETAGTAIGEVNTKFQITGKELESLSSQFIKFSKINDVDVTSAIDGTQKALAAFGLGAEDASGYLDRLTLVSQKTGVDVNTLNNIVLSNSTALKEMGLSIDDATVLMGQLELSGVDSAAVMNGLSKALKTTTAQGIPLDKALSDLQRSIDKGTDSTDGLTMAYKYFGKSGAYVYEAVKSGTIDFNNLATAADTTGDVVTDTFNATLDPADQFQVAMNAIKVTGASIASVVMPALSKVLEKVRDVVLKLKEKWDSLTDSQKENIVKIAAIAAAIGPLIVVIGKLVTGIGSVISIVGTLTTAFSALSPTTLAIGAVVAAVAALVIKNWDKIKAFWEAKLKPAFENIKQIVVDKVVPAVKKAWENLQPAIQKVFQAIKNVWENTLKPAMQNLWNIIVNTIIPAVKKAWENLKPIVVGFFNAAKNAWTTTLKPALDTMYNFIVKTLVPKVKEAWEALQPVFETVFNAVQTAWETVGQPVMNAVRQAFSVYVNTLRGVFNGLITFIKGVFSGNWKQAWQGVKDIFGSVFSGLGDLLKKPINAIIGLLNSMIAKIEGALNKVISGINKKLRIHLDPISVFGKTIFAGIDWGPELKEISFGRIKTLYKGGVLEEGQRAVVGEYSPEYLTVRNGRAVVTPMNTGRFGGGNTVNNVFNIYAQPGMNVNDLAREVGRIFTRQAEQMGAAYA